MPKQRANDAPPLLSRHFRECNLEIAHSHPAKTADVYPFVLKSVLPVFVGKDARTVERLLWDVYRHADNYKMQGIALWVAVAAAEIGLLELMGRVADRPVADFFGGAVRRDVPVYFASGNRGNTPEREIEYLQKLVAGSGVKALKFRLGGRMSRNADDPPGRTEKLIPLARRAFGPGMTLYGDANSSYDPAHAVRIGRLMEEHGYGFFEEPVEFDDLWGAKEVADALTIPVAAGEQEYSLHRWKWTIANRGVDVVQPDLHYGGGFVRATQVARMAAAGETARAIATRLFLSERTVETHLASAYAKLGVRSKAELIRRAAELAV